MRITFACVLLGSFFTLATKAAEINQDDHITAALDADAEGIPVSVNVIQTAQVVVLNKEQILSIAADINAQSTDKKDTVGGAESEVEADAEIEGEEIDDTLNETEALLQQANHLTTSWSVSGVSSYPHVIDTAFTFSPLTLAPESSRSIMVAPSSTLKPTTKPSTIMKKVKSGSDAMSASVGMISTIALSICIMGQYL